jgi:aminoglycoside phosphotransferase (APT) family kinase protein
VGAVEVDLRELTDRLAPVGVADLRPLPGGASSLTYTGVTEGGTRRVVVKVAPAGVEPVRNRDVLRQAKLLRALEPTPVPVPEVLWEDRGAPPEVPPLFVMTHIDGTSLEPLFDLDGDDDEAIVAERMRNAARTMGLLHAIDLSDLSVAGGPRAANSAEVDRWCRSLETVDRSLAPGWKRVAKTLRAGAPAHRPDVRDRIVHGDFRLGNLLALDARITAVIDWEIWSFADPRLDVGWFLVNADPETYRRPTRYVGSLPGRDELVDVYAEVFGAAVPDLRWFEALACFKSVATWALIVKHNRRRTAPDPELEAMAHALPRLLALAEERLA